MSIYERIIALDDFYGQRPQEIEINGINGRIIYSEIPSGLFNQYDPKQERIATMQEIMKLRAKAFEQLLRDVPCLDELVSEVCKGNKPNNMYEVISQIKKVFDEKPKTHGIWKSRLTSSTNMIHALDHEGIDTIFFYNGIAHNNEEELSRVMEGKLSDGGIEYNEEVLNMVRNETPLNSRITYKEYINNKGGNFTGEGWLKHPIFATACGDNELMKEYIYAMQVLNLTCFYNQGWHSGWRPGEMKLNFGRLISLGYKGDTFYPPNNSTFDHATLILSFKGISKIL